MSGWPEIALRDLGDWYGGGTPSKANPSFWKNGHVPWLSPKDMGRDVIADTRDHISDGAVSASAVKLVPPGSVAIVVRSGILERTLPVAVVPFETTLNQDMKAVAPREDVDPRWIAWGIRAFEAEILGATRKRGTTVASLEMPRLLEWRIPLPPFEDQREVLDLLEDHLSRLDAGQRLCSASSRRLALLRRARWQQTFISEPLGPIRNLLDVVTIANGQTPKGLLDQLDTVAHDESVPYFKVGDMNHADGRYMSEARFHVSRETAARLGLHVREAGTVLLPKRGGAIATNKKRLLRAAAAFDLNTMGLVCGPEIVPEYLWHWFDGVDLGRLADGSNVPQINAPQIRSLAIPVPSIDIQHRIVDRLDDEHDRVERAMGAASAARDRAAQLRSSLLAAAFAGRLTSSTAHDDLEIA